MRAPACSRWHSQCRPRSQVSRGRWLGGARTAQLAPSPARAGGCRALLRAASHRRVFVSGSSPPFSRVLLPRLPFMKS